MDRAKRNPNARVRNSIAKHSILWLKNQSFLPLAIRWRELSLG